MHGDGARWIAKALEDLPGVIHVLDGFHIRRAVRQFSGRMTGSAKENRALHGCLTRALRAGKLTRLEKHMNKAMGDCVDEGKQKKAGELLRYAANHMDAVAARYKEGMLGSCTEAQVQRISAARFSSQPCGWSIAKVDKLAGFRALTLNGQELFSKEDNPAKQCPHKEYVDRYIKELMHQPMNLGIFDPVAEPFDRSNGT